MGDKDATTLRCVIHLKVPSISSCATPSRPESPLVLFALRLLDKSVFTE